MPVTRQQILPLCNNYGIDQILASILVRRGITQGKDILYFLEDDLRFQHNPFLFSSMEDAVTRILQAKDEKEKVLIFGDKDADGVTSTTILYTYLKSIGIDVSCRIPVGDDAYGLSMQAVDDFAKEGGTLIITVDCGISNFAEISHAADLCIDVIVTDHHNAPEKLPEAVVILDPKTEDSGYPFKDISGAAVAYKLVSALRFAQTGLYENEYCILNISENEEQNCFFIDCIKIRNLIVVKELHEKIIPGQTSIYDLKLPYFLQGQLIYVWDKQNTYKTLNSLFGNGIDFNLTDLQAEICTLFPKLRGKSEKDIQKMSIFNKYIPEENNLINSIYNLFVTYCRKKLALEHPEFAENEKMDLQLVALAAIADIMPLKNENRIFIKNGVNSIKTGKIRPGLAELFAILKINIEGITATDLSWSVTPALNAAGRLGQADLTLALLTSENAKEREELAHSIYTLNEERKNLVQNASLRIQDIAKKSVEDLQNKLCLVIDEQIHPGITGNFAGKLMQDFNVPAIVITKNEGIYKGSMRSCRGLITTEFLSSFEEGKFFINYGGHDCAAGFSFVEEKLDIFMQNIKNCISSIQLEDNDTIIDIDAEIPTDYITEDLFDSITKLEPYGAENPELKLLTHEVTICDAAIVGKKEPFSLKLTFDCGKHKIPAVLFGKAEKLGNEIQIGKKYDIIYTMSKNYFRGNVTNQFKIQEIKSSDNRIN